ncbi:putative pantetheine-phosphate adenylyltransferase [Sporobolomyces salmoneus]|uniref:putative pantetheine-phosphate adenylyltransferase n=1 Tax=Sporobolomyces salmoneus TaxID=183962 RepID=UPI003178EBD0
MAPIAAYDTYLALHFPSLSTFLSSTSHLSVISSTSKTSSSLLISIKSPPDSPSPWSDTSQLPSAASGSSSSSSSALPSPPPPIPSPSSLWLPLEGSLASIYSAATREFLRSNRILAKVDVVLDQMRTISTCSPPGCTNSISWTYSPDEDQSDSEGERIGNNSNAVGGGGQGSYEVVATGGTFDHLHAGHKILLTMACSITSRKLIVGVSDEPLLGNKKFKQFLQTINERISSVERFIELVRPGIQHQVVPLQDVYGPTATDPDIQALVVSEETRLGGDAINKLRSEKSLSTLETYVINLVSDDGSTTNTISKGDDEEEREKENQVKVAVETKMGSTGIREWMSKQESS